MTEPIAEPSKALSLAEVSNLTPKPPRSKLEPHRELIRELRRKGRTYREIAKLFADRLDLHVAASTLHSFVKVRARHREQLQFELPPAESAMRREDVSPIAALKTKPTAIKPRPRFVFHDNEPLTLKNPKVRNE